jgi:hypothetical protein
MVNSTNNIWKRNNIEKLQKVLKGKKIGKNWLNLQKNVEVRKRLNWQNWQKRKKSKKIGNLLNWQSST